MGKHHSWTGLQSQVGLGAFGPSCPTAALQPSPPSSSSAVAPLLPHVTSCSDCSRRLLTPGRGVPFGHLAQVQSSSASWGSCPLPFFSPTLQLATSPFDSITYNHCCFLSFHGHCLWTPKSFFCLSGNDSLLICPLLQSHKLHTSWKEPFLWESDDM